MWITLVNSVILFGSGQIASLSDTHLQCVNCRLNLTDQQWDGSPAVNTKYMSSSLLSPRPVCPWWSRHVTSLLQTISVRPKTHSGDSNGLNTGWRRTKCHSHHQVTHAWKGELVCVYQQLSLYTRGLNPRAWGLRPQLNIHSCTVKCISSPSLVLTLSSNL